MSCDDTSLCANGECPFISEEDSKLAEEIAKLCRMVDGCAALMKKRLIEKARVGYTGWNDQCLVPTITNHLRADVDMLDQHFHDMVRKAHGLLPLAPEQKDVIRIVDVMNRSGFLLNALLEGNFEG